MNFENIDLEKINIDDNLNIRYNGNKLVIKSPVLYVPFGVDHVYNNIILKLQMKKGYYKDDTYTKFTKFIENLEILFKKNSMEVKTQLSYNENFGNLLTTKILNYKERITIDILKNNSLVSLNSIEKKDFVVVELLFDKLWIYNNNLTYKIKLNKIEII